MQAFLFGLVALGFVLIAFNPASVAIGVVLGCLLGYKTAKLNLSSGVFRIGPISLEIK